jgi:HEPN domain-containing protein
LSYLNWVRADIKIIKYVVDGSDEFDISMAAYHCQQAVEKLCSVLAQNKGIKPLRTHDIIAWVDYLREHDINLKPVISSQARLITDWEASARYNLNFVGSRTRIKEVCGAVEAHLALLEIDKAQRTHSFRADLDDEEDLDEGY